MRVAVDVGADLQNGDAAIAARQLEMVGLRKHHRRVDGSPVESLESECKPNLFGKGREVIVMENEFVHDGDDTPDKFHTYPRVFGFGQE